LSPLTRAFCVARFFDPTDLQIADWLTGEKKNKRFLSDFPKTAPRYARSQICGITTAASMRREDALEIIGVARDACEKTITRAFRSLAQKHHPGAFPLRPP
jgi:DnaJ-domain-containing protein 1